MTRFPRTRPSLPALLLGGAVGLAALLPSGDAEAGRIRFGGGGVHVNARFRGGVSIRYARPAWRPRIGGSIWVGSYYRPRAYYYYYPEYVPSYYGPTYYPVQPAPSTVAVSAPGVVAPAPVEPELPSFGLGVFAGGSSIRDRQDSSDVGLLARLRLSGGLLIEGEVGKTSFEDDVRVDRRIGGSLIYEIGAQNALAPYVLGGIGVQQADVGGSFTTTQDFGEIGVGIRWSLSRNLALTFDIRAGRRQAIDSNQPVDLPIAARTVAPPITAGEDTEDYSRGRLAAILSF